MRPLMFHLHMAEAEQRRHWVLYSVMEKEKRHGPSFLRPFNGVVVDFRDRDPWELNTTKVPTLQQRCFGD